MASHKLPFPEKKTAKEPVLVNWMIRYTHLFKQNISHGQFLFKFHSTRVKRHKDKDTDIVLLCILCKITFSTQSYLLIFPCLVSSAYYLISLYHI